MTKKRALHLFLLLFLSSLFIGCSGDHVQKIAYIWVDEAEVRQLFLTDANGRTPIQLSAGSSLVAYFTPAPDGTKILYTKNHEAGETTIHEMETSPPYQERVLMRCQVYRCERPVWANDGRRIIYERRDLQGNEPQLWWLDSQTNETVPVFSEPIIGYQAAFSADDAYLSFVNPIATGEGHVPRTEGSLVDIHGHAIGTDFATGQEIIVYHFKTGKQLRLSNLMNTAVTWSPTDSDQMLMVDMQFFGEKFGVHLLHVNVKDNIVTDISNVLTIEDSTPNWSTDGEWITFGRKGAGANMGMQLWVVRPDGSEAQPLTEINHLHHGMPQWATDGKTILYQSFNLNQLESKPSLQLYDMETNKSSLVIAPATQGKWIPQ